MIEAGTGNEHRAELLLLLDDADRWRQRRRVDYRWNIANCNTTVMGYGDLLSAEPGNMVGPTSRAWMT